MASKRRLSRGNSSLLSLPLENDIDIEVEIDPMAEVNSHGMNKGAGKRNSLAKRRTSMFGSLKQTASSPSKILAEQTRIAEMYKSVIKLSSENKITEKNSWSFDLIDHMGTIIKEESQGQRGVNFQKASCTLDASVKIYSNRVDDTYATSHRILESLSRNDTTADDENSENPKKAVARVGSKHASNRLNITETIERNIDNLNVVKVENDHVVDPMFHKMSKAFDEGGAKGMLLSNLRTVSNGCAIIFTSANDDDSKSKEVADPSYDLVDISQILPIFATNDFTSIQICEELNEYRRTLGISECTIGCFTPDEIACQSSHPISSADEVISNIVSYADDMDDDIDNETVGFNASSDFSEPATVTTVTNKFQRMSIDPKRVSLSTKFNWDSVFGSETQTQSIMNSVSASSPISGTVENRRFSIKPIIEFASNDDYHFFNLESLNKTNSWAGAKHWKYVTRNIKKQEISSSSSSYAAAAATVLTGDSAEELPFMSTDVKEKSSKKSKTTAKSKKATAALIDFSESTISSIDRSLFDLPTINRSKNDPTQLTAAAIDKMESSADDLLLPFDSKVTVKDLCRLFTLPNVILPPSLSIDILKNVILESNQQVSGLTQDDMIWGSHKVEERKKISGNLQNLNPNASSFESMDYDENIHDNEDDCTSPTYLESNHDPDPQVDSNHSVNMNNLTEGLVQAKRTVEKIDIKYATVAKRVNVRKLKYDIWDQLDNKLARNPKVFEGEENTQLAVNVNAVPTTGKNEDKKRTEVSFQELLKEMSSTESQKEATLPFYFICLLHLANEKVLKIDNSKDGGMSDLIISRDR